MRVVFAFLVISLLLIGTSFSTRADEDEEEGWEEYIEFTGTLNYILFGLAILILPWKYIYKSSLKRLDPEDSFRDKLRTLNSLMKNLHYILGGLAVLVITYHAYLTREKLNLILMVGLSLIWFFVITGVMPLIDKVPNSIKKWAYRIHGSKIYLVITGIMLYLGHVVVD